MSTGFFPLLKDSSPLIAPGLLAPDPRFLFPRGKRNQKDAQETTFLENLPSLRGFFVYATTCLSPFPNLFPGPMTVESPPPLPGPLVFFVGFASEKHDSSLKLPGHRHGAGETDFLSCAHGASAAQSGRDFYMEGRQAQYR